MIYPSTMSNGCSSITNIESIGFTN